MRCLARNTTVKGFQGSALALHKRNTEYWCLGVSSRTQPYCRGDVIPKLNVPNGVVNTSTVSASLTGNNLHITYDSDNIFSASRYSEVEKNHFMSTHASMSKWVVHGVEPEQCAKAAELFKRLMAAAGGTGIHTIWFQSVLQDFPSMKGIMTESLQKEFAEFYLAVIESGVSEDKVAQIAKPFVAAKLTDPYYISLPTWWRISESLMISLEKVNINRYEKITCRPVVERVTKIALNTIADQPWAHQDYTHPSLVQLTGDRICHEGGMW